MVEMAIHPGLAKRFVVKDSTDGSMLNNMGSSELLYNTEKIKKSLNQSSEPFKAKVPIFDISKDIASVKVTQNKMSFLTIYI